MYIHTVAITVKVNVGRQPTQVPICLNMHHIKTCAYISIYTTYIQLQANKKNEGGYKAYLPKSLGVKQLGKDQFATATNTVTRFL